MTKHIFTKSYSGLDRRKPLEFPTIDPIQEATVEEEQNRVFVRASEQRTTLMITDIKNLIVSGIQSVMPQPDTFNQAEYERSKLPWTPKQKLITLLGGITLVSGIIAIKQYADQIDTKRDNEVHELNEVTKAIQFTDK